MNDELRKYIDNLFLKAPKGRSTYELKEEIFTNSMERFDDLVKDGISDKEAFEIVVNSIGDINELFSNEDQDSNDEFINKKVAIFRAGGVALFILSFVAMILIQIMVPSSEEISFIVFLVVVSIAIFLLVYQYFAYPGYSSNYVKIEDSIVEDFKEWNHNKKRKSVITVYSSVIVWLVVFITYFAISFTTDLWQYTWIIF